MGEPPDQHKRKKTIIEKEIIKAAKECVQDIHPWIKWYCVSKHRQKIIVRQTQRYSV